MSETTTSPITTHVLDVSIGKPAAGVPVVLEVEDLGVGWRQLGRGATDKDGRLRDLLAEGALVEGTYRLTFDTHTYFADRKVEALYPQVSVVFSVRESDRDYHIPLLLSPFGYSTYRGS
ncbi:MAG: hydroxyisourate hydrolase [Candidatus Acidiferrum sp.]|jgi:5-hydroxyisourate hydrolase